MIIEFIVIMLGVVFAGYLNWRLWTAKTLSTWGFVGGIIVCVAVITAVISLMWTPTSLL